MTLFDLSAPVPFGYLDTTADAPGVPVGHTQSLWDFWVRFPQRLVRRAPRVQRQVTSIMEWTGWSARTLAELLGTTHPTISGVATGRSMSFTRAPELPLRIGELHELLERLVVVAEHDRVELNRILRMTPSENEPTALDYVVAGDVTGAWLAAIDVINPRRADAMMRGHFPAQPGTATTAIDE